MDTISNLVYIILYRAFAKSLENIK